MPYALCRIRNLHRPQLRATQIHNAREYEQNGLPLPDNINPGGGNNYYGSNDHWCKSSEGIEKALDELISKKQVKERSNSVVAIEYVLSVSKDGETWEKYSPSGFFSRCVQFIGDKHGHDNILSFSKHFDETNPHIHIVVAPVEAKEVKWKNTKGEGVKREARFNARAYTGGPELLRNLQNEYHSFVHPIFSRYGLEITRGTLVEKKLKQYTQHTSAELGRLRDEIERTEKSLSSTQLALKESKISVDEALKIIQSKEIQMKELEIQQSKLAERALQAANELKKREEIRKVRNKNDGWKRGMDFDKGF
ncbi:MAG: plasmid recombination protein [Cytophagales bacterium]|nr:plasmid recombination protein [Cytophagales bacterium]